MKTATVRDLRNRFPEVAAWIEDGERVTITRRGVAFATLSPSVPEPVKKVDWVARFKKRQPIKTNRKLTKAETQAFYDDLKREF
jgi:antitoxin (DNA-binding transcriptional repressor) of toxin-antitoxin stability system